MRRLVAGVDLGGTGCRFVTWAGGQVVTSRTYPTASFACGGADARLARLVGAIVGSVANGDSLEAVGIGASGPVDTGAGMILNPDTLPMFSGVPLVSQLQARLGIPVVIDNDAVTAAIAEHRLGAGMGAARMLMVTLGTGIGVAFLAGGTPFRGPGGAHPEGGHFPIHGGSGRCYCGAEGCWEVMASRTALQASLRDRLPPDVAPAEILPAALVKADQDPAVAAAFESYGGHVGRGLAVLHTLYMPEVTVLGGSAAAYLSRFAGALEVALARAPGFTVNSAIRDAALGDQAGAIGGALIAERILGDGVG